MSQAVTRRPFTAEARVRARISPCAIYVGQSGTGASFFSEFFSIALSVSFHRGSRSRISCGG
jgi:hypothetical protein